MPDLRFLDNMLRDDLERIREEWNRPSPLLTLMLREVRNPAPPVIRWRWPHLAHLYRPSFIIMPPQDIDIDWEAPGAVIPLGRGSSVKPIKLGKAPTDVVLDWDWPIRSNGWYERRLKEMGRV